MKNSLKNIGVGLVTAAMILAVANAIAKDNTPRITIPQEQTPMTRKEAFRASTNQIVLHYGDNIKGTGQIAEILSERGYPAVAFPGRTEDGVEAFVDRGIIRRTFTQREVDNGILSLLTTGLYYAKFARKPEGVSLPK